MMTPQNSTGLDAEVMVVGGGLAGLIGSIQLAQAGLTVILFEKTVFPKHKVCGEYISNEVRPILEKIGLYPNQVTPIKIDELLLSAPSGNSLRTQLPLGGFGISRYAIDLALYELAIESGVKVYTQTSINAVHYNTSKDQFTLSTRKGQVFQGRVVLGSFGKRSMLDRTLDRGWFKYEAPYIGIKYHLKLDFPSNLVSLHNFWGGYAGLSKVEDGSVNFCYLISKSVFQRYNDIKSVEREVLSKNPFLKSAIEQGEPLENFPLSISNISFRPKSLIQDHILMAGDAAGLISPLAGNGMAMAIHAADIAAKHIQLYMQHKITRSEMEQNYWQEWNTTFRWRLWAGRQLQKLFGQTFVSEFSMRALQKAPSLVPLIIRQTHGKYDKALLSSASFGNGRHG
ncbi:MAG: NAD(P)/FAD-dependent oxidoreductase [Saprospiraceae bacterium]|nr:NAD(P)/FAD-dependent oxidoreductase [Saprospiraceae bacterium]